MTDSLIWHILSFLFFFFFFHINKWMHLIQLIYAFNFFRKMSLSKHHTSRQVRIAQVVRVSLFETLKFCIRDMEKKNLFLLVVVPLWWVVFLVLWWLRFQLWCIYGFKFAVLGDPSLMMIIIRAITRRNNIVTYPIYRRRRYCN